jgi:hypothetical protein
MRRIHFEKEREMHLINTATGEQAKKEAASSPPFGPGFGTDVTTQTEKLEVWGSDFKEGGDDYCLFKAIAADGQVVGQRRVGGY